MVRAVLFASLGSLTAACIDIPGPAMDVVDAAGDGCVTAAFADGSATDVRVVGGDRLALAVGAGNGKWQSPVLDRGEVTAWGELSWTTAAPARKPLPGDAAIETGYEATVDMTGNVLLYHLDEPAPASFADASGQDLDATCLTNCPALGADARFRAGAGFDGVSDQRLYRAGAPALEAPAITIEAWARKDGGHSDGLDGSAGMIVAKGWNGSPPYNSYALDQVQQQTGRPTGALRCWAGVAGADVEVVGTTSIPAGQWFHAACVIDDDSATLYVDGAVEATLAMPGPLAYDTLFTGELTVGTRGYNGQDFHGVIDEVAVYARALSAAEIRHRWLRGALDVGVQVRGCDDPACDGESWRGPDGTDATRYAEACNPAAGPPRALPLNDADCDGDGVPDAAGEVIAPSRYVQVRFDLATLDPDASAEVLPGWSLCPAS